GAGGEGGGGGGVGRDGLGKWWGSCTAPRPSRMRNSAPNFSRVCRRPAIWRDKTSGSNIAGQKGDTIGYRTWRPIWSAARWLCLSLGADLPLRWQQNRRHRPSRSYS